MVLSTRTGLKRYFRSLSGLDRPRHSESRQRFGVVSPERPLQKRNIAAEFFRIFYPALIEAMVGFCHVSGESRWQRADIKWADAKAHSFGYG